MLSNNWAPAPRVKCLAFSHLAKLAIVSGTLPGTDRDDCKMVFMVLAGCMMVCAAEREMAPQIIASQKWSRRSVVGSAACLAAPPLSALHGC